MTDKGDDMDYKNAAKLGATLTSVSISHRYWTGQFAIAAEDPGPAVEAAYAWFSELVDGLTGTEALQVKAPKEPEAKPETTREESGEVGHVAIKKFALMQTPKGYELKLYPDIQGKPGKWPELSLLGDKDRVWAVLKPVWDEDWKPPVEKEVDWIAEYVLGKEYTVTKGDHAGETRRYKDLSALREA